MKVLSVVFALLISLMLCSCGSGTDVSSNDAASGTSSSTESVESPGSSPKELAQSCIGKSVDELYGLVGAPENSAYADSCLGDGEDGNLFYDGFTVGTFKDKNGEVVKDVW